MQRQTKIRFDAIKRAQKLLEAAPEPRPEEVTESHAARILIPQIRDAQSKGYSLRAIASLLLDSGMPVSASLLKTVLSQDRSRNVSKADPQARTGHAPKVDPARDPEPSKARTGVEPGPGSRPQRVPDPHRQALQPLPRPRPRLGPSAVRPSSPGPIPSTSEDVGVEMTIADHPLRRAGQAALPHPALALGGNAKSLSGPGVADSCLREPAVDVAPRSLPRRYVAIATTVQAASPPRGASEEARRRAPRCSSRGDPRLDRARRLKRRGDRLRQDTRKVAVWASADVTTNLAGLRRTG